MAGITTSPQLRESPETANLKAGVDESWANAKPVNIRSRHEDFFIWSFGNIPLEIESTERRQEEQTPRRRAPAVGGGANGGRCRFRGAPVRLLGAEGGRFRRSEVDRVKQQFVGAMRLPAES